MRTIQNQFFGWIASISALGSQRNSTERGHFGRIFLFLATLIPFFWMFFAPALICAAEDGSRMVAGLQKYRAKYMEKLEELASWCDENHLESEAQETRAWITPDVSEDEIHVSPLPSVFWEKSASPRGKKASAPARSSRAKESTASEKNSGKKSNSGSSKNKSKRTKKDSSVQDEEGASPSELKAEWEERFRQLRMTASNDYLKFAKKAVSAGHVSFGFNLLMQSLHENPDNPGARKILGYQKSKNGWQTDFERLNQRAGNVWHERFGWIPKKYVAKYDSGKRFFQGQWISEEQDAQLHSNIEKGWVVETGHFQIITDSSIEDAVRVGQQLEKLYRVWKQLFLNYYATESQIRALFERESSNISATPKHRVLLFNTLDEYSAYLSSRSMMVPGSVGVYVHRSTGEGVSCFVAGEENDRTMFHEVTHQLFEESCKTSPKSGSLCNYWVIEAAATFMESFHEAEDGSHAVGGFDDERVRAARIYYLNSQVFTPFEDFVRINRETWQSSPKVGSFYAQACGMAHFLVFYDHGKYRDAFGRILFDVYSGRDTPETVAKHTGVSYEILNQEYREFISQNAEEVEGFQIVE